jgi:transcriptional regulator with XRE-family HTH domain
MVPRGTHLPVYRRVSGSREDRLMDDGQIGRLLRAVRLRRNMRQVDVAEQVGVHQGVISDLERGGLETVGLATARRVAHVLDVRLVINAFWRGGEGDRLLDRAHAALVEHVIAFLRAAGWQVMPEFTFNVFGDRGSVDILAWHPIERILLIVEVKSILTDIQNLLSALSRKLRVVPRAAGEQLGWRARHVAVLVVAAGSHGNRAIVARHASTFDSALPSRSMAIRTWIRRPVGSLSGLWFVSPGSAPTSVAAATRARVRR